jgi:hypothetical protein
MAQVVGRRIFKTSSTPVVSVTISEAFPSNQTGLELE